MSRKEKLLSKARNNTGGLHFDEFLTLMKQNDWIFDRQRGSHQIWISPEGYRISVQDRGGSSKRYQVEQFLAQLSREVVTEDA